jgi:hypothetical protein
MDKRLHTAPPLLLLLAQNNQRSVSLFLTVFNGLFPCFFNGFAVVNSYYKPLKAVFSAFNYFASGSKLNNSGKNDQYHNFWRIESCREKRKNCLDLTS